MKKALGRGLGALIPQTNNDEVLMVDVERVLPNPAQPRKVFLEESLKNLAESIAEKGVIQPLVVSRLPDGAFQLIAGERRLRASISAGLSKVPCIVRKQAVDVTEDLRAEDSLLVSLIENIQREDLNPLETAQAFKKLSDEFNLIHNEIARKVGKDRATVTNYIRLLSLPEFVRDLIAAGTLSMGHAKALLSIDDMIKQEEIARLVVQNGLSVRETERLCKDNVKEKKEAPKAEDTKESETKSYLNNIEIELTRNLGTRVRIIDKGKKGKIEIEYYSDEELSRLVEIFKI
ncbi:MAG: ParB/RepB/Spo0J family partition protein [Candidatus Magnetoovum sp. WYHC-5]|nr:ParB/RepB/Spo0J family partition protein [Candidatus Magnetoovum sp. WYHC-5]